MHTASSWAFDASQWHTISQTHTAHCQNVNALAYIFCVSIFASSRVLVCFIRHSLAADCSCFSFYDPLCLHEVAGVWVFMFVERCLLVLEPKNACVACTSCPRSGVLLPTQASAIDTVDTFLSAEETPAFFRTDPPPPPPPSPPSSPPHPHPTPPHFQSKKTT